jgi:hypothetical protein
MARVNMARVKMAMNRGRAMGPKHQHDLQALRCELSGLAEEVFRTTGGEVSAEIHDRIQRLLEKIGFLEEVEGATVGRQ